jgi:hypothetical protein
MWGAPVASSAWRLSRDGCLLARRITRIARDERGRLLSEVCHDGRANLCCCCIDRSMQKRSEGDDGWHIRLAPVLTVPSAVPSRIQRKHSLSAKCALRKKFPIRVSFHGCSSRWIDATQHRFQQLYYSSNKILIPKQCVPSLPSLPWHSGLHQYNQGGMEA